MEATKNNTVRIEEFLNSLDNRTEINDNLVNYVDIENIDFSNAYQSIYEMVDENDGFNIKVIYYSTAIQYLMENDNSLRESLELADEMGYSAGDLNSEILASILKSENARNDFRYLETEINDFFLDLEEEEEEEN